MAIDEKSLSKGEMRKLVALRKSLGDKIADKAFAEWYANKPEPQVDNVDPIATKIEEALSRYANDKKLNLGRYGYTIRRAKGKGASGFVAIRNEKAD